MGTFPLADSDGRVILPYEGKDGIIAHRQIRYLNSMGADVQRLESRVV